MPDLAGKKTAYYGFTGLIEPASATRIAAAFNHAVNNGCDEIYLCLSSTGGYVADGVFLYNHIMSLPAEIIIHNTGTVMSIAAAFYIGAKCRYCSKHGVFMIHPTEMPAQASMRAEQLQTSLTAALADDQRTDRYLARARTYSRYGLERPAFQGGLYHVGAGGRIRSRSRGCRIFSPKGGRNYSNLASRAACLGPSHIAVTNISHVRGLRQ